MNTIRFTSRDAFVAALEERRSFWEDYDKRQAQKHKADEKEWHTNARTRLREVLKMDYATLKTEVRNHYGDLRLGEAPTCPRLMEKQIDGVLAAIKYTQNKVFTVDSEGTWRQAHNLLTWDPDAPTTVC